MTFDFQHEVDVRYRDLDTYGHVNNVVYGTYCEQARIDYLDTVLDVDDPDELTFVLASLDMEFHSSVTELTTLEVAVGASHVGDSSFTMEYEVRQDGQVVVEAQTTQVYVDPATRETRPLPDQWRERFADFEGIEV